ncbi:MAG TPA: carboxymuconolactone decarboxylase family protein, partial [Stellaceae bacterium]|nr:carboxymuconolactone decarboxylase family protein [Stellaceae bacterium]
MTQINLEELGTEEKTDGRGLVGADRQHEHSRARSAERRDLRKASPEVMRTFSDMARAAHDGEALDGKTKELVALAIGVAVHCSPCIA